MMMIKMMLMYHMEFMMMTMMTMLMSMMMMLVIILLDTAKLEILELITSNRGCEVLTIKILLSIWFYIDLYVHWVQYSPHPNPLTPTPLLQKGSTIPPIMVLPKCHPTRFFWTTHPSIPSFFPITSKAQEVDININTKANFICTLKDILVLV